MCAFQIAALGLNWSDPNVQERKSLAKNFEMNMFGGLLYVLLLNTSEPYNCSLVK